MPGAGRRHRTFDLDKDQMSASLRAQNVPEDEFGKYHLPPADRVVPMITGLCADAASDISGQIFGVQSSKVTRWTDVRDGSTIVKDGIRGRSEASTSSRRS